MIMSLEKILQESSYRLIKYLIMAMVIAGALTIPIVFQARGDYWGRVVTALWTLIVVALSAWLANKVLWGAFKKKVRDGAV